MNYIKSKPYDTEIIRQKIMGPNPVKLTEELLKDIPLKKGSLVMDLGSGQGVTSVFLAKEYGVRVIAADLWSDPSENMRFFEQMGLSAENILPVHADATDLPFPHELFDAIICIDAYHYFGRDKDYLGNHLLPFVKHGGYICIAVPGMKKDCHDDLPPELLLSWTPEQLDYIHDAIYWTDIMRAADGAAILSIHEMESNEEVWNDWLATENPYAVEDRKSMEAGACRYMNFIAILLQRK